MVFWGFSLEPIARDADWIYVLPKLRQNKKQQKKVLV
jgi:hypothetical protein